jgi:hypothetical protein
MEFVDPQEKISLNFRQIRGVLWRTKLVIY